MPQFSPREAKRAIAPIMVSPSGISAAAELFLGPNESTKVATSGLIPFTSTGFSQNVQLPVAMPWQEGIYKVFLDLFVGGRFLTGFVGAEDVVIQALAPFTFDSLQVSISPDNFHVAATLTNYLGEPTGAFSSVLNVKLFRYPGLTWDDRIPVNWSIPGTRGPDFRLPVGQGTIYVTYFAETYGIGQIVEGVRARAAFEYGTWVQVSVSPAWYDYIVVPGYFEGVFSSTSQTWQPTNWRPPAPLPQPENGDEE